MTSRLAFHPDLDECCLEDRCLLAYSPGIPGAILTTGGFIIISTPPGLSTALSTFGGGSGPGGGGNGSNGGNMPTSFNISGFGPSTFGIGNVTGFPALSGGGAGGPAGGGPRGNTSVGSGANDGSGGAAGASSAGSLRNFTGFGGSFSSGYNTSLNATNSFGMGSAPVGSLPVNTFGNASAVQEAIAGGQSTNAPPTAGGAASGSSTTTPPASYGTGTGTSGMMPGTPGLGNNRGLINRPLGNPGALLIGPGLNKP